MVQGSGINFQFQAATVKRFDKMVSARTKGVAYLEGGKESGPLRAGCNSRSEQGEKELGEEIQVREIRQRKKRPNQARAFT